ncbi:MAG: hypothetical protein U0263_21255 [Polyangiaceae bacterium]
MAPRGLYQRGLSQAERWAIHRSELIRSTADAINDDERALNVDSVVRRCGKGRNTFYAHFGSVEQAVRAVETTALQVVTARVQTALSQSPTPRERMRAVTRGWLEAANQAPELMRAFISARVSARAHGLARQQLRSALEDARRIGMISGPIDEARLIAAVGSFLALVRTHVEGRASAEAVERAVLDVLVRVFR